MLYAEVGAKHRDGEEEEEHVDDCGFSVEKCAGRYLEMESIRSILDQDI